jgi:glutamate-1-semialdehyde 2,1-aminomutase
MTLGVAPDMAVFAKALGNGYPISAIVGREAVMTAAQDTFISSTAWTERIGFAAALACLTKHRALNVGAHLVRVGEKVVAGWRDAAARAKLPIDISGIPPLAHFSLQVPNALAARTLFTQLMLDRGFLAKDAFYAMLAHSDRHVDDFMAACDEAFTIVAGAVRENEVTRLLRGPVAHAGFQRLT